MLALEPTKFAFDKLKTNLALNKNLGHCVETYQIMLVEDCDLITAKNYILAGQLPKINNLVLM